jgi:hypothetical protein
MVRNLLFIIGLVFTSGSRAQEWFPVGASWYYNQVIFFEGDTYSYFQVTGETVIQGKNCKVINGSCNCGDGVGTYLYQEGDKIFAFDFETDTFRLLYDFTLLPGDTIKYMGRSWIEADGYFVIDSITNFQAGSQNLRVQHLTSLHAGYEWGSRIIERIGATGCLYPQVSFCDPSTGGLRCYEDDETGLLNFQTPPRPCNRSYIDVKEPPEAIAVKVYPNPATRSVHIQSEKSIERIILFNNLGIPVYHTSSIDDTDFEFNASLFPGGLYHFQIMLGDHQMVHRSIVIQ